MALPSNLKFSSGSHLNFMPLPLTTLSSFVLTSVLLKNVLNETYLTGAIGVLETKGKMGVNPIFD